MQRRSAAETPVQLHPGCTLMTTHQVRGMPLVTMGKPARMTCRGSSTGLHSYFVCMTDATSSPEEHASSHLEDGEADSWQLAGPGSSSPAVPTRCWAGRAAALGRWWWPLLGSAPWPAMLV